MSLSLIAYANFPSGTTGEAMAYYQGVFGGKLEISTFGEFGMEGMPADGVMHSQLITDHFTLMASDAMPGAETSWGGTRIYLALMGDDAQTLGGWFDALAADGSVGMPLEKQVWGDTYGILKDKYGLEWMFNISAS
ncbi:VOC family protein [Propionicimonas sp.]|uniref:VOC family protein n=1 Tax=Propionicimonas sp. TaxID=1955623 RepID=UPI0039E28CD5